MDESPPPSPSSLERLRRQRANRRGNITRYSRKVETLASRSLCDVTKLELTSLLCDLDKEIAKHSLLQDEIELLVSDDYDAPDAEMADRDRHDEVHSSVRLDIESLHKRLATYALGTDLELQLNVLINLTDFTSEATSAFKELRQDFSAFTHQTASFAAVEEFTIVTKTIKAGIAVIHHNVATSPTTSATPVSPTSSTEPTHQPISRVAPVNIDLPKFSGNPLDWRHFEIMFASTLDTRKDSVSNGDKVAMLSAAIPDKGRQFLNTDKNGIRPVEDILDDLRQHYGRPEVVVPLRLRSYLWPPSATLKNAFGNLKKQCSTDTTGSTITSATPSHNFLRSTLRSAWIRLYVWSGRRRSVVQSPSLRWMTSINSSNSGSFTSHLRCHLPLHPTLLLHLSCQEKYHLCPLLHGQLHPLHPPSWEDPLRDAHL